MQYAFDPVLKRFRNFMSYDRRWLEAEGSEDSQGRALWALGTCAGRSRHRDLQAWAAQLFERALPAVLDAKSPRAWAFTLLDIYEYFRRLSGDRIAAQARDVLTQRLIDLFENTATDDWPWFEDSLSYANARLPQVLILRGRWADNARAYEIGLRSLRHVQLGQLLCHRAACGAIGRDGIDRLIMPIHKTLEGYSDTYAGAALPLCFTPFFSFHFRQFRASMF